MEIYTTFPMNAIAFNVITKFASRLYFTSAKATYIYTIYLFKIYFNIIFPETPNWSLTVRPDQGIITFPGVTCSACLFF